jgi:hypothetical protein
MNRHIAFASFAFVVLGYLPPDSPLATPSTSTTRLAVVTVDPPPGAELNAESTLRATLEFQITPFLPGLGSYVLMPLFESTTKGKTFNGYDSHRDAPKIGAASGRMQIEYPMSQIWLNAKLRRPVRVWFFVTQLTDDEGHSRIIARVGPYLYR